MRILQLFAFLLLITPALAQTREKRQVGTFSKISYRIPGKMYLKSGSSASVEISGPADVLKKLETRVESDKLIIEPENSRGWKNRGDFEEIKVYITIPKLNGLSVAGSGKVIGEGKFSTKTLDLDMAGSGAIQLEAESESVNADISGSGQILISGNVGGVDTDIAGSGLLDIRDITGGSVHIDIAGSGTTRLSGKAAALQATIAGSGNIESFDLEVKEARIKIAGSGNAETRVTEGLDAEVAGSGSVQYKGTPTRINLNQHGSGKVRYAPEGR